MSAIISVGCAIETRAETVTHNFYVKKGIPNKDNGEPSLASESILPQLATSAPDSSPQTLPASGMQMEPGTLLTGGLFSPPIVP